MIAVLNRDDDVGKTVRAVDLADREGRRSAGQVDAAKRRETAAAVA